MMRSSLAALLGIGLTFGAFATPVPALEAEQFRAKMLETFSLYEAAGGPGMPAPLGYEAMEVEEQGEGFRVTLSGLRLLLDPAEAARLDIGSAAFTMTPAVQRASDDLFYVSDLSLSPYWVYSRGDGPPSHVVRPGAVSFEGLWSFAYLTLLDAKISTADAVVETSAGEPLSSFESIQAKFESRPADKGRYDFGGKLRLGGIMIRDDRLRIGLGAVESEVEVPGHDPAAAAALLRGSAKTKAPSSGADEAASANLFADLFFLSQGGRMTLKLHDLRGLRDGSPEALEIDGINIDYAVSDHEEAVAKVDMALAQTGLRVTAPDRPASGLAAALMPTDSSAMLSVERLPLRTLLGLLEPLAQEAAAVEGDGEEAPGPGGLTGRQRAAEAGEKLIEAMSVAGTTLDLSGTRVAAPKAQVALKGGMVIDAAAAFGVRGTLLAEVGGFDTLVEVSQRSLGDPNPGIRAEARQVVGILALLQTFADRDETGANGPIDRFLFKVDPNGAVSVNDKPLLPPLSSQ